MKNAALGILLFTVASRLVRVAGRWDEWALHYATYNEATRDALLSGNIVEALTSWVGLHPPGYPLLHSVVSLVWPAPIVWLLISAGASVVTVWAMLRSHPQTVIPALVVATDPVQLHYAAEVNNYPLATMLLALAWIPSCALGRRCIPRLLGAPHLRRRGGSHRGDKPISLFALRRHDWGWSSSRPGSYRHRDG